MSIVRHQVNQRMSQIVVHNGVVYLAGQVASGAPGASVTDQIQDILRRIDQLLGEAGTDKSKLLTTTIWMTDMEHFDEMNKVWDAWVAPGNPPVRACVEAKLAASHYTVEIMVTAALA